MATATADSYSASSGGTIYAGTSSTYPTWRQGLAVNAWTEIVGSSMAASPPSITPSGANGSISAVIDSWNGLSIDTRVSRIWSLWNGGHMDTFENGARYLDLALNAPVWVEVLASNTSAQWTQPNSSSYYSNGRPASRHSYYGQQFIKSRNRAMTFGAGAVSTTGSTGLAVDGYNCNSTGTGGIDAASTYPDITAYAPDMAVCKDPTTEDVYVFNTNVAVYKWTNATNLWSSVNVGFPPATMIYSASAYDSTRSRILLISDTGAWTFDPATGAFTTRTLTGSYTANVQHYKGAMVYAAALDKFVIRVDSGGAAASGPNTYTVDPATFATALLSVTGGSTIPAGAGSNTGGNPYGKLLEATAYGGVVWIPSYASNAWFLRLY